MTDLVVPLYRLPSPTSQLAMLSQEGVVIRRAMAYEAHKVLSWVEERFGRGWRSEVACAFGRTPVSCFVALKQQTLVGFAAYDVTYLNFFGPTGVDVSHRGKGVGTALLNAALDALKHRGYAYAIIGNASNAEFYLRTVGAIPLGDSPPGAYPLPIRDTPPPER